MGGYVSGRPSYKAKIEANKSMDVNGLQPEGKLAPGRRHNYNNVRPHLSLRNQALGEARRALEQFEDSAHDALAQTTTKNTKSKLANSRHK